jgi:hypothetical protein
MTHYRRLLSTGRWSGSTRPRPISRATCGGVSHDCVSASKKHPVERVDQRFDSTILISVATGSRPAPIGPPPECPSFSLNQGVTSHRDRVLLRCRITPVQQLPVAPTAFLGRPKAFPLLVPLRADMIERSNSAKTPSIWKSALRTVLWCVNNN